MTYQATPTSRGRSTGWNAGVAVLLVTRQAVLVFFADLYGSWQRGANQNPNGLMREYLPRSTDLSGRTQRKLNAITCQINTRSKTCLGLPTPLKVYAQRRLCSPVARGS